jgi:hypothetical protein
MRMESDEFDFMAPTYVRGFLKNYARFLHADPEPLIQEFDRRFGTGPVDTSEIIALTQRDHKPRAPRRDINRGWLIAGAAAFILILLTLIGLAQDTNQDPRDRGDGLTASPSPTAEPTSPAKATASPRKAAGPPGGVKAFADGIDVAIEAESGDCYLEVTVDGEEVYVGTLNVLDSTTFKAKKNMEIFFGAPSNVDIIIEGEDLGDPSGPGEGTVTVRLPKDYKRLKRQAAEGDGN